MDIEQTRHIDWTDVTRNVDNSVITRPVGYSLELVDAEGGVHPFPPIGTPLYAESEAEINFFVAGIKPGEYTLHGRTHVDYGSFVRMSARGAGVPLVLEQYPSPNAPDGLTVS